MSTDSPRLDRIEMLLEQIAQQQQRTQLQIDANTRAIAANSEEISAGFIETRRTLYDAVADLTQIVNGLADLQQQSITAPPSSSTSPPTPGAAAQS